MSLNEHDVNSEAGDFSLESPVKLQNKRNELNRKRRSSDWSLVQENVTMADCEVLLQMHTFSFSIARAGPAAKVSKCAVHNNCDHVMRMQLHEHSVELYDVHECGEHNLSSGLVNPMYGMNAALQQIVDVYLHAGTKPVKVLDKVFSEHAQLVPVDLCKNDLLAKIRNRKKCLSRSAAGGETDTISSVNTFLIEREVNLLADSHMVSSEVNSLKESEGEDGLISLGRLPLPAQMVTAAKQTAASAVSLSETSDLAASSDPRGTLFLFEGVVFSSPRLLNNINTAVRDLPSGVPIALDGTYNLIVNNWVLILLGTHTVNIPTASAGKKAKYSHSTIPFVLALVRTECTGAYEAVIVAARLSAQKLYGVDLVIVSATMDHAPYIMNAVLSMGKGDGNDSNDVRIVSCWAHVLRKCRERAKGALRTYFDEVIYPQLVHMHLAPTRQIMLLLGKAALRQWRADRKNEYADWFEQIYLAEQWSGWHISAASVAGTGVTNNALESLNNDIKRLASTRTSMLCFFRDSIPRFLRSCALRRAPAVITQEQNFKQLDVINTTIVPRPCVDKALRIINEFAVKPVKVDFKDKGVVKYFINKEECKNVEITSDRVRARRTQCTDVLSFNDLLDRHCSLHAVEVHHETASYPGSSLRTRLSCDCKQYWVSGFVCAHVLAVMHVTKQLDLNLYSKKIDGPKKRGRPKKARSMKSVKKITSNVGPKSKPSCAPKVAREAKSDDNTSNSEREGSSDESVNGNSTSSDGGSDDEDVIQRSASLPVQEFA